MPLPALPFVLFNLDMHNYKPHQLQQLYMPYQLGKHLVVKIELKYSHKIITLLVYLKIINKDWKLLNFLFGRKVLVKYK